MIPLRSDRERDAAEGRAAVEEKKGKGQE